MIVGCSAAGVACAKAARTEDPEAQITLIGAEPYPAYHRPRLTHVLGKHQQVAGFLLHDESWYRQNRLGLVIGRRVVSGGDGFVIDDTGERYAYDSLVLATGGLANVPPIPGVDLDGVFCLRTYSDLEAIEQYAESRQKVVIIGGGLIGLEAAWALCQWRKQVSVLERGEGLLKNQLDEDGMSVIGNIAVRKGVNIVYKAETKSIVGEQSVSGVKLKDGRCIESDLVLLSTGVRADLELAKALDLPTGRGVLVDERMQVAPGIYAAGDCAEYAGRTAGVWPVAEAQGKVAGTNAAGGAAAYRALKPLNTTVVMGVTVFSAGDPGRLEQDYRVLKSEDDGEGLRKLYLVKDRLVGAIVVGVPKNVMKIKALIDAGGLVDQEMLCKPNADAFIEAL